MCCIIQVRIEGSAGSLAPSTVEKDKRFNTYGIPRKKSKAKKVGAGKETVPNDFQQHWPTDEDNTSVGLQRKRAVGNGAARMGNARLRRLTEERAGGAKSVFQFYLQGSLAKFTHAGPPASR
jgi:hypothetical protein